MNQKSPQNGPKRQNTNGILSSYFSKIYDNFKPNAEQGLYNLGEKIETNASNQWNNLSEMTHESLKSADGYIKKYQ